MNPPGFNIDNALSIEDVDLQVTSLMSRANPAAIKLWGPMLIEDRHASMSDYRDWLTDGVAVHRVADKVRGNIDHVDLWGMGDERDAIY